MRIATAHALLISLSLSLGACGSVDPIDQTHQGEIAEGDLVLEQDGSLYDEYSFRAKQGMTITLSMQSTELDSYLILLGPDGEKVGENDDISSEDRNSSLTLTAPAAGEYKVVANTYEKGQLGSYTLRIQTANGG